MIFDIAKYKLMGYVAIPFAVELERVRGVFGSNDLALLEKVKSCDLYETYASQSDSDFDQALEDIIVRYIKPADRKPSKGMFGLFKRAPDTGLDPKLSNEYGYALLTICDTLGTNLSPGNDVFYAGSFWKEANELFKEKDITIDLDRMWQTQKLFDIPDVNGFPVISHYTKQEIDYLLSQFHKIEIDESKISDETDFFDELQELLYTFREGLKTCKQNNAEWVSFLH